MKILLLSGSLRKESLNKKLLASIKSNPIFSQHQFIDFDLQSAPLPVYDGDLEAASGVPASIKKLGETITQAEALIVSSPEYNGSVSSSLKTAIDWLSRIKPVPLTGKNLLLLAASPGALGGVRGLWHTRVPLEVLGVHVFPDMFGLAKAHEAFNEAGQLKDEKTRLNLENLVGRFTDYVHGK